ncbi:GLEYA domain-containing protein [Pochonia chlamydosporia 170]|uniref:GLEYA domain-containing protein n=1 Tax=Pochonia chlamydosporia 170 TaxID=1380566 RepID=A0A179FB53_METCM|nr:GLEYA domain-containing protein [Pochonia chlamydosporia 170]OAQ62765.1 GLEYA domain-containing protein [Pochonia chlamydosporia 170]
MKVRILIASVIARALFVAALPSASEAPDLTKCVPGLRWAYYKLSRGDVVQPGKLTQHSLLNYQRDGDAWAKTLDIPTLLRGQTPAVAGTTAKLGTGPPNNVGSLTTAVYGTPLDLSNAVVQHIGYFYAKNAGSYLFKLATSDTIYLWLGNKAKSGFNSANADVITMGRINGPDYYDFRYNAAANSYIPIRILYVSAQDSTPSAASQYGFYFEIRDTSNNIFVDPWTAATDQLTPSCSSSSEAKPFEFQEESFSVQNLAALGELPQLDESQKDTLSKLVTLALDSNTVQSFVTAKLPVTLSAIDGVTKRIGAPVLENLDSLPSRPATIVFTFLGDFLSCTIQGKTLNEAYDCATRAVSALGDSRTVVVPERCNNPLGQLEIPFTGGWPARCHDPTSTQHPEGNWMRRALFRGLCKTGNLLMGSKFAEADRVRGRSCDDRFPSDADISKIKDAHLKAKMELALTGLIDYHKQVQARVDEGGVVTSGDVEKAAEYIAQGAFPSYEGKDKEEAMQLARLFMGNVQSAVHLQQWASQPVAIVQIIPMDQVAIKKALEITNTRYPGLFQDTALEGNQLCYSAQEVLKLPFSNRDRVSESLIYIEQTMRKNVRTCKGCPRGGGKWAFACGRSI